MPKIHSKVVRDALKRTADIPMHPVKAKTWKPGKPYSPGKGQYGRGESEHCYNCSLCEKNNHDECERLKMEFCGCWRNKHNRKAKSLYSPPVPHHNGSKSAPARVAKPQPAQDDDTEWEDV